MNIINKTLLPISNLPEGEAILNINIYEIDNSVYLSGTELTNAYTVTPNKSRYNIGETVTIVLNTKYGTLAERTFTRVVTDPITTVEFNISASDHEVKLNYSSITSKAYAVLPSAPNTTTTNRLLTSQYTIVNEQTSSFNTTTREWTIARYGSSLRFRTNSTYITPFYINPSNPSNPTEELLNLTTEKVIKWGAFKPSNIFLSNYWSVRASVDQRTFFPKRIPSSWTSLSGLFKTFNAILDIPSTWDISNINSVQRLFSDNATISTFPTKLFSKSYVDMKDLFRFTKLDLDVDLSLVDYSLTTTLGVFVGQYYYSEYYDKMLKKWVETTPENRSIAVTIQSPYTTEGEQYRNILLERGWDITDLGLVAQHTSLEITAFDSVSGVNIPNLTITYINKPKYLRIGSVVTYTVSAPNYPSRTTSKTISNYGENFDNISLIQPLKQIIVTTNPVTSDYTITKTPDKAGYYAGDEVTVRLGSTVYQQQVKTVIVGAEDTVVHFDLELKYPKLTVNVNKGFIESGATLGTPTIEWYQDGVLVGGGTTYETGGYNYFRRGSVATYRVIRVSNYPESYFAVAEGSITIGDVDQTVSLSLLKQGLTLTVTTLEGSDLEIRPNQETYKSNDVVTIVASKEGMIPVTRILEFVASNVNIDVRPIDLNTDTIEVEFEYNENVTEYGFTTYDNADNVNFRNAFVTIVGGTNFENKTKFTKEEILINNGVVDGRIKMNIIQPTTVYNYSHLPAFGSFFATKSNSAPTAFAPKIWVNKLPNWSRRLYPLFYKLDVQYCVEPIPSSVRNYYPLGNNSFDSFLSNIGQGEDSALNLNVIRNWDFNQYTDYARLFQNSYINFSPDNVINFTSAFQALSSHYVNILEGGQIVDPAKYDDFLRNQASTSNHATFGLNMGTSKYTNNGVSSRAILAERVSITDGGLVDQLTYPINILTNVSGVTITKSPNQSRYNVGTIVTLTATKSGYETQTKTHTIQKYLENNTVEFNMVENRIYPNIIVKDENNQTLTNSEIILEPNKESYSIGETVEITVSKAGYETETRSIVMNGTSNDVTFNLIDISMEIVFTKSINGSNTFSIDIETNVETYLTHFDGSETKLLPNTSSKYYINGNPQVGVPTKIYIKPTDKFGEDADEWTERDIKVGYIVYSTGNSSNNNNYRNRLSINKWGVVKFASGAGWLINYPNNIGYIDKIAKIPNQTNLDYLFQGLTDITSININSGIIPYSIINFGALSEWDNMKVDSGNEMFRYFKDIPLDPRNFDLTDTHTLTAIFKDATIQPINGENAYDLWLIHLAQNYLGKELDFEISMGYTTVGANAKAELVNAGWTITDLGLKYSLKVTTTPSEATVSFNPNKTEFNIGENVEVTISKDGYDTQVINHVIINGVNSINVTLSESLPPEDGIGRLYVVKSIASEPQTGSLYANPKTSGGSISNYSTIGGTSALINNGLTYQITFGNSTTGTKFEEEIKITYSLPSLLLNRITVAPNMEISLMTWGCITPNFVASNNTSNNRLFNAGKIKFIRSLPTSITNISYMFYKNASTAQTADFSQADFSDWNKQGQKSIPITAANYSFYGLGVINLDPRVLDFTNCTNMTLMFTGTQFTSSSVYDDFLIYLNQNFSSKRLSFGYGGKYTSAGASARASLVSSGFTITDGGLES